MITNPRSTQVNGSEPVEISPETLAALDLVQTSDSAYHAVLDGKSYSVHVKDINYSDRSITLSVNGSSYTLSIQGPTQKMIESMGYNLAENEIDGNVKAPMPGLLFNMLVKEGQSVEVGDHLCILEAMKMENILKSPSSGVVSQIMVKKGDSVNKGDILITIEPSA